MQIMVGKTYTMTFSVSKNKTSQNLGTSFATTKRLTLFAVITTKIAVIVFEQMIHIIKGFNRKYVTPKLYDFIEPKKKT